MLQNWITPNNVVPVSLVLGSCGIIGLTSWLWSMSKMRPLRRSNNNDNDTMLRVGVVGAGAIGTVIGLRLSQHKAVQQPVVLVGRASLQKAVLIGKGQITIVDHSHQHKQEVFRVDQDFCVTSEMDKIQDCHIILVTVKTTDTETVAAQLAKALPKDSTATIISMQNGLHNAAILGKALRQNHAHVEILASVVALPAEWEQDTNKGTFTNMFHVNLVGGCIVQRPSSSSSSSQRVQILVQALQQQGFPRSYSTTNITAQQCIKLLFNLINPINALAGVTVPAMLAQREYRLVLAAAVREGARVLVGRRSSNGGITTKLQIYLVGCLFPFFLRVLPNAAFRWLFAAARVGPAYKSSMLQDLERRRPCTEIHDLSGEIVRVAASNDNNNSNMNNTHAAAVPVNTALVKLVQRAEKARQGSPRLSAQKMLVDVGLATR